MKCESSCFREWKHLVLQAVQVAGPAGRPLAHSEPQGLELREGGQVSECPQTLVLSPMWLVESMWKALIQTKKSPRRGHPAATCIFLHPGNLRGEVQGTLVSLGGSQSE